MYNITAKYDEGRQVGVVCEDICVRKYVKNINASMKIKIINNFTRRC